MSDSNWLEEHATLWIVVGSIALITIGHYATDSHDVVFHNVYRRLYYIPVVLAAFGYGLRGGIAASLVSSLAYIPHAFLMHHHHMDPAPTEDKVLEIVLYLLVGAMTGWLVERQNESRRQLERSLYERDALERQLVRAGKLSAMGELLAGVAHELRNPLAAILGAAEGLSRELGPEHRKARLVELQLREISRLDRVVTNFLAFAREGEIEPVQLEVSGLLDEIIDLAAHHGDGVRFLPHEDLAGESLVGDRDQLGQVLLNLLLNAIQAAHEQEQTATISFHWEERLIAGRSHHCLGVRDRGPGIAPEHLEKIFDPYFTTRASGSGLGLSISSRLIEAHGGFLDVVSAAGETTFWICLPERDERVREERA